MPIDVLVEFDFEAVAIRIAGCYHRKAGVAFGAQTHVLVGRAVDCHIAVVICLGSCVFQKVGPSVLADIDIDLDDRSRIEERVFVSHGEPAAVCLRGG